MEAMPALDATRRGPGGCSSRLRQECARGRGRTDTSFRSRPFKGRVAASYTTRAPQWRPDYRADCRSREGTERGRLCECGRLVAQGLDERVVDAAVRGDAAVGPGAERGAGRPGRCPPRLLSERRG